MKKNLLTFLMAVAAIGAMAEMPQPSQRVEARQTAKLVAPTEARMSRSLPTEVITEAPAGQSVYCTTGATGYEQYAWGEGISPISGEKLYGQLVTTDNGEVYYSNFVPAYPVFTFAKGVEADGVVTFDLPQCIYSGLDYDGSPLYLYAQMMDVTVSGADVTATVNAEATSIEFTVTDNGMVANIPSGQMLGVTYADGTWTNYGVTTMEVEKMVGVEKVSAPADAEFESWQFVYSGDFLIADGGILADVAIVGDELYVKNFLEGMPEATFKLKIEGDKALFESDQFMGGDPYMGTNIFLTAGYGDIPEGAVFPWFYKRDSMELSYDAEAKTFKSEVGYGLFGNIGVRDEIYYYYLYYYANPILKPYDSEVEPAAPKAPIYVGMMEYMAEYGMGQIYFCLPCIDINDNFLATDHLYYNFLCNGCIYELYPDEYFGITEEIEDIPWLFTDDMWEIYGEGVYRYFTFKIASFDSIGIQQFYLTDDGERLYSDIMTIYPDGTSDVTSGAESLINENAAEVGVEYFDLQGRKIANPISGSIMIQRKVMSDGSSRCEKRIVR
ncbi:MAG: hypothetical protein LIP09_11580 [Bacteroidales bacterium]|nr:hypothetical protein [Bacteroidales bacterium]